MEQKGQICIAVNGPKMATNWRALKIINLGLEYFPLYYIFRIKLRSLQSCLNRKWSYFSFQNRPSWYDDITMRNEIID